MNALLIFAILLLFPDLIMCNIVDRALRSIETLSPAMSGLLSQTVNSTCGYIGDCDSCINTGYFTSDQNFVNCVWCDADNGISVCVSETSLNVNCPDSANQYTECGTSYYTYVCIIILSVLLCLCACTCYLRRYHSADDALAPMLPSAARHFLWRSSFSKEGRKDWMCIICGFDNKMANVNCIICGTSHEFSANYKAGKREQQNGKVQTDAYNFHADGADQDMTVNPISQGNEPFASPAPKQKQDREFTPDGRKLSRSGSSLNDTQFEALLVSSPRRTTHAEREEAFNYRRLNQLSLRQKAGRRRRMWQRVRDESTGGLVWIRAPPQKTKLSETLMGYTPRSSFDGAAAVAQAAGERNMNSTNRFANRSAQQNNGETGFFASITNFFGFGRTEQSAEQQSLINSEVAVDANNAADDTEHTSSQDALQEPRRKASGRSRRAGNDELREALLGAVDDDPNMMESRPVDISKAAYGKSNPIAIAGERSISTDSFGDSTVLSGSPGYTTVFDEKEGMKWERVVPGLPVNKMVIPKKAASNKDAAHPDPGPAVAQGLVAALLDELETVDLIAIAALSFKEKQLWFLDQMGKLQKQWADGCIRMEISRNHILDDSLATFGRVSTDELHKWIRIKFTGEPGVDAGGLEREWFTLVVNDLFDPKNGLFTCSSAESMGGAYHINPTSDRTNPGRHLEFFTLAGRILGKSIMEQQAISATLSLPLRKQILNVPITFSDLEFVDPVLYRNLKYLETYDNIENLSLDFTTSYPVISKDSTVASQNVTFELKPGGGSLAVTNENRDEYLQLLLANRMLTSVKSQVEHLLSGLYEVIPPDLLSIFDYQELELLICGVPNIDVKDWAKYTEYMGGYSALGSGHKVIRWFWAFIEACNNEERARILQFITGCSRVPAQGFKALVSNDGKLRKFNIQSISKKESMYPRSHTCFNKLDLPMYDSASELEAYMSCVTNGDVFGFTIE